MKKWKVLSFICILALCFSATAFAAEEDSTNTTETIDWTENEGYAVRLDGQKELTYTYTGDVFTPEVSVVSIAEDGTETEIKNENEELYEVSYAEGRCNAGTYDVTVTAKEDSGFKGELKAQFTISPADLKEAEVVVSSEKYVYTGKTIEPKVVVKLGGKVLESTKDYQISCSDCVNVGTAKVTITGCGNYQGTATASYQISLGTPSVSTSAVYNKVTVSWKKITGAKGYKVYRATSKDGTYTCVKDITSGTTLKYVDEKVAFNKTYYYKVKAYTTNCEVESAVKSQKVQPGKVTISSIERASYNSLKLTWKKVAGASGYAIYRSSSENGTYERVATVKNGSTLTYTNKSLSCTKKYYYKVRAYRTVSGKNYYGSYSNVSANYTLPAKVTISSGETTYNSTKITLHWKETAGASGYQIYRATSKSGTYKKVGTVSGKSTTSWKDTGLTKGKTYYYKVRAYGKVDGKTVYGSYSSVYTKTKAGWRYVNGYKLYYNANGKLVKDVSSIIGKQSSYVIKVNKQMNCVTVYAKDGNNGYIIPVKAFICSTGYSTPTGTFYTPAKYRWHTLMGPSYGQWCTRIYSGFLFHSVFYNSYNNNNALSVTAYNKLGTTASHGCVRLTAGDAKWIYDNCKLNTKVIIYNSSSAGPLGKPTAYKLPSWHTWDPTDPNMKSKCKSRGCH